MERHNRPPPDDFPRLWGVEDKLGLYISDCVGVLWEHETEDLRLGLMLSCGSTQTRYFELTIRQKGATDNGEE